MWEISKEILQIIIIGLILRILYAFLNPDFNSLDELPHLKSVKFGVPYIRSYFNYPRFKNVSFDLDYFVFRGNLSFLVDPKKLVSDSIRTYLIQKDES